MHAAARSLWRRFAMPKMRFAAPKKKSVAQLKKPRARQQKLKKPSASLPKKRPLVWRKPLPLLKLRLKLHRPLLPRRALKRRVFSRRLPLHGVPMAHRRRRVPHRVPLHLDLPVALAVRMMTMIAAHRVAAPRRVAASCVRNQRSPLPRVRRATTVAVRAS